MLDLLVVFALLYLCDCVKCLVYFVIVTFSGRPSHVYIYIYICIYIYMHLSLHLFVRTNPREPAATARRPLRIGVLDQLK